MVIFTHTAAPTNEAAIAALEQYAGVQLPAAYRAHLLQYNGGDCTPADFEYLDQGIETESMVDAFLPLTEDEPDNLRAFTDRYKIREQLLPQRLLPIAIDPGENLICISCAGEDEGAIYFADMEQRGASATEAEGLFLIQPTLDAFLSSLKEGDDDDWSFMS